MSMQTELEERIKQLRTRWLRWLGQKTRSDKPYWTTLLGSDYKCWAGIVLLNHNIIATSLNLPGGSYPSISLIKEYYSAAINCASLYELAQLDELYCCEKFGL